MRTVRRFPALFLLFLLLFTGCGHPSGREVQEQSVLSGKGETLPSWRETATLRTIIDYVTRVTSPDSADYIPPADRIAVFDNDGTLWAERPLYFQLEFIFDRVRALEPQHPEWKRDKLIQAVVKRDLDRIRKAGAPGIARLMDITQAGMTTEAFTETVRQWIATAHHPVTGRPYTDMVYQPMLELIRYLEVHEFKVFIISGGDQDFLRAWAPEVYGIPREQIIGSRQRLEYRYEENGKPVLYRLPEIEFLDEGSGKAIAIHQFAGRRPVIAFGNSDSDIQMLEYTRWGKERSLVGFVHHTDARREWAYDRNSAIGRLDKGLDRAKKNGWLLIDIKKDWKVVYPYEEQ